jgi:hypothetical protein
MSNTNGSFLIEDNPSFTDSIRLYSHSGLCNRLRLITGYKYLSDLTNKKIEMFWVKSRQCNTLFKDLFEPIPNVNFHYLKWNISEQKTRPPNTARTFDLFPHSDKIRNQNHLIFKPLNALRKKIDEIKNKIDRDYIACHVRRTDIIQIHKKYGVTPPPDEFFFDFVNQYPNHNIFLATDDRKTQTTFSDKFGDRLILSATIARHGSQRWPIRTTPISEAVIDLFLCIGAHAFIGTNCSSFSGFINGYRKGIVCQKS